MALKAKADIYIARLLMLSFVLPMQMQTVTLFAGCIYFIVRTVRDNDALSKRNYTYAALLGALYIAYLIAVPFTPAEFRHVSRTLIEYKLAFLALPVVAASVSVRKIQTIIQEFAWFVYGSLAISVIGNVAFIAKYLPSRFSGVNHVTYRIYFEDLTGIHPTYISMYLVLGISMLAVYGAGMNRVWKYSLFYLSLFFLLPLMAKSPLLALVGIFVHMAWQRRSQLARYKWIFIGVGVLTVASYLFVPFVSQRVNEMAGIGTSLKQNVDNNSIHERKMILAVDLATLKHYWAAGCGPGRLLYILKQHYLFYSVYYGRDVNAFDPHNEYFYHWISLGLPGIILLLTALIMHFVRAVRTRQYVYIYLLITLYLTFFTESVLATQHGLLLYAFFASLFFFNNSSSLNSERA